MIQPPVTQEVHLPHPTRTVALAAPGTARPVTAIEQAGAGASLRGYQRHAGAETERGRNTGQHNAPGRDTAGTSLDGQRLSRALSRLGQLIDVYA